MLQQHHIKSNVTYLRSSCEEQQHFYLSFQQMKMFW